MSGGYQTRLDPRGAERRRQAELEAALFAAPLDPALLRACLDHLARTMAGQTGLHYAVLPQLEYPVALRGMTGDAAALARALAIPPSKLAPRRILELGAGVGCRTLTLARDHPDAEILAVETDPDAFRVLVFNTSPYRRIRTLSACAWPHPTRLRPIPGPGGTTFDEAGTPAQRIVVGLPIPELLRLADWDSVEWLVSDLDQTAALLAASGPWRRDFRGLLSDGPAQSDTVSGRQPADLARPAVRCQLLHNEPGTAPVALQNVGGEPEAFFVFGGGSCQLRPNPTGMAPARAIFSRNLTGHKRLEMVIEHAGTTGVVCLAVDIEGPAGRARAEQVVSPGEAMRWMLPLPGSPETGRHGVHRIVLETRMAPPGGDYRYALARFIDPVMT